MSKYVKLDTRRSKWHIVVVGAGGTGSYVLYFLTRLIYSLLDNKDLSLVVYEGDIVERNNLLRQNFFEPDIDRKKADVLVERYGNIYGINQILGVVPEYVDDYESLIEILNSGKEGAFPILVGCVDNNATRKIFQQVFDKMPGLFYIDSGNGTVNPNDPEDNDKWTGQVVVGLKLNGQVILPPVAELYPDVMDDVESRLPTQSCGTHIITNPQLLATNGMSAQIVFSYLNNIVTEGILTTHATTFNTQNTLSKPRYITDDMLNKAAV